MYWIELDKHRPCVVSSDDVLGVDVWQTHVAPITSNVGRAGIAGNVSLLGQQAGRLPEVIIGDLDEGPRAVLGI